MNNKENEPIAEQELNSSLVDGHKLTRPESEVSSPSKGSPTRSPLVVSNTISPTKSQDIRGSVLSPKKTTSSTRVIESLHKEIDELKSEVLKFKSNNEELKKTNELVRKRRDQLMEQLSNSKHENETVNSLLQRKQRRINDLESQLNEITSSNDDLKFKFQSLETRSEKLRQSEASSVSEYERMKIAYETMVTSQKEYREYYSKEIKTLKERLNEFIKNKEEHISRNITLISKSDSTIARSIKSITSKSRALEQLYEDRDLKLKDRVETISASHHDNNNEVSFLLQTSKDLFHEIADKLEIDKEELLKTYLEQDSSRVDPFKEVVETKTKTGPKSHTPQHQSIQVKKRNDRKASNFRSTSSSASTRIPSLQERVSSLDKELNKSIPLKDRITPNVTSGPERSKSFRGSRNSSQHNHHNNSTNSLNPLFSRIVPNDTRTSSRTSEDQGYTKPRNTSRNDSRRSSKLLDENKTKSGNASRRSSRLFDSNCEMTQSPIDETTKKVDEVGESTTDTTEAPKRKRRRRRRRRGKKHTTSQIDENNSDNDDDEEDDDEGDDHDSSTIGSDVEGRDSEKKESGEGDVLKEVDEESEEKKQEATVGSV